jgi:hypothetical protein
MSLFEVSAGFLTEIRCQCLQFLPLQFLKRWLTFQVPGDELSCDENSDAKLDDESQEIGDDNGECFFPFLAFIDNITLQLIMRGFFCLFEKYSIVFLLSTLLSLPLKRVIALRRVKKKANESEAK